MIRMIASCSAGLLLGMILQRAGLTSHDGGQAAAGFLSRPHARTVLYALGLGMVFNALLCYLAVTDVELLDVRPLDSTLLLSGVLFGAAAGLCGATPATLLAGLGGGRFVESLCGLLGCAAGALLVRLLPVRLLPDLFSPVEGTLFRLTLTDPFLFGGAFASLACAGVLVCVCALLIRPRPASPPAADPPAAPEAEEGSLFDEAPDMEHPSGDTPAPPSGGAIPADDLPNDDDDPPFLPDQ